MFGLGKRAKRERAARDVLRIGNAAVDQFNAALDRWKSTSLDMRRTMLEDAFAERAVQIEPDGELSFEHVAEVEALALMANWTEQAGEYVDEFYDLLGTDALEILRTIGVESELDRHVDEALNGATGTLDDNLTQIIIEAVRRRGEVPDSQKPGR